MQSSNDYKNRAVASLSGNWGSAAILVLLFYVIYVAVSLGIDKATSEGIGSIVSLLLLPMTWGVFVAFLDVARGSKVDLGYLTLGYKDFTRIFLTMLLKSIYILLWSLLLVVPGIIKSYSYDMTEFVLRDHPELKYDDAISESSRMMKGHKMDLFLLDLSLIGWLILSMITCGIGLLFLIPYYQTAHAHFYEDLVAENTVFVEK